MRNYFLFFFLLLFFNSCQKEVKNNIDTSTIEVKFMINRFEQDFYSHKGEDLEELKKKYPILFPENTPDSIWMAKIKDKDEQELYTETQKLYSSFSDIETELRSLFKYITHYNPMFNTPNIITGLSNIDYNYRVIYNQRLVFISLDVYLGSKHPFYSDYPAYIKQNNIRERIVVDVANAIIDSQIKPLTNRSFLAKMIHEGKKLYLLDLYLPLKSDAVRIGYTKQKYDWAITNEEQVWKYFIENNLLYSTDTKLNKRFLEDAPFSKFYLSEDKNSPGRIGQRIGLQIVRSFMDNNDVSLSDLLIKDGEEIFKNSKYKPRK
ncbi:MAG: gliding motility lipoprotein GldB [Flavobacteriaceae bacterium]|nr:gliding motility lipoprotein GldB [Flavobacteriaceae bacterium]